MTRLSTLDIIQAKGQRKLTMLTAYDYTSARLFDQAGIDPPGAVSPSANGTVPSPFGARPVASVSRAVVIVNESYNSATSTSSGPRPACS